MIKLVGHLLSLKERKEYGITHLHIWSASVAKGSRGYSLDYPDLQELIQNMFETNTASDGVGLAAPQIGKSIRVVVVDLDVLSDTFPEYKDYRHAFINGHILEYDDSETETLEEGCLSLPGVHECDTCKAYLRKVV